MRKTLSVAAAVLYAVVFVAGTALADPHPDSCSEPATTYGGDADGGYLFLCTEDGYFGGTIDSSGNGYLLIDGAQSRGDYNAGGYVVVIFGPDGASVGCSNFGSWNEGGPTRCPG